MPLLVLLQVTVHVHQSKITYLGLRAWHISNGVIWNGGVRLAHVVGGVHRLAPSSSIRSLRDGVTLRMMILLVDSLDVSIPFEAAVLGCALCAFWTQSRLGELLPMSSDVPSQQTIPHRSDLGAPSSANGSRVLHYRRTKTNQTGGEDTVITRQLAPADPINGMEAHLLTNYSPNDIPLFAYSSLGVFKALTKKDFLEKCNLVWTVSGIHRVTGHSFRIGGTTHLLQSGISPVIVKRMGRWSSDTFLRYWRGTDTIVPLHAELLPSRPSGLIPT